MLFHYSAAILESIEINGKIGTKWVNQKQSPGGVLEKVVYKNFAKFTGKHLCQSLFFNKVAGLRPNISKKDLMIINRSHQMCSIKKCS